LRETNEQLSGARSALEKDIPFMEIEDVDDEADTKPKSERPRE
jgi:hypothetical protein